MSLESPRPGQFHAGRPTDLRRASAWHRLSYIVEELPRVVAQLTPALEVGPGGTVLDYGCADMPYRSFFGWDVTYLAADIPGNPDATVEVLPDGTLPLDDDSVDAVISTQVLEHVTDPATYLRECHRVLRPGGRMLLTTHGLMVYHPDPVDYWRWTCAGLQRDVESAGLEVVHFQGIMGVTATGLQLFQDGLYWRRIGPLRHVLALVVQTLIRIVDRIEPPGSREYNALVFAVVAQKP